MPNFTFTFLLNFVYGTLILCVCEQSKYRAMDYRTKLFWAHRLSEYWLSDWPMRKILRLSDATKKKFKPSNYHTSDIGKLSVAQLWQVAVVIVIAFKTYHYFSGCKTGLTTYLDIRAEHAQDLPQEGVLTDKSFAHSSHSLFKGIMSRDMRDQMIFLINVTYPSA
jgi:hypothetical protein